MPDRLIQPIHWHSLASRSGTNHPIRLKSLPPLTLYIHYPWCLSKCPYCDFNSHTALSAEIPQLIYVDALLQDIEQALPEVWGRKICSIFIGGGTPSLISPEALERLLIGVRALLPLNPDLEISLEANPGTVSRSKLEAFKAAGVTRLSVGVQSFQPDLLVALERMHSGQQAIESVEIALEVFGNVNVDLMYALPGQEMAQWIADLDQLITLAPPHISCYQLAIEPNTAFFHAKPNLPNDEVALQMQQYLESIARQHNWQRYEVSAFARPGFQCAHNLNYWRFGDYLGVGAGAHAKLSFADKIIRQQRYRAPKQYLSSALPFILESQPIPRKELGFEFMLNALRLVEGVPVSLFVQNTGCSYEEISEQIQKAVEAGLLVLKKEYLCPTEQGMLFLNDLQAMFLV